MEVRQTYSKEWGGLALGPTRPFSLHGTGSQSAYIHVYKIQPRIMA